MPAVTTPFAADGRIDHDFLKKHVGWLADHGCRGIVALGSLGEGATLGSDEKRDILRSCVEAVGGRIAVVAGIAALSTDEVVDLAVYVYQGDWPETRAHFDAVIGATGLSCMLYNNPIAYGTDVLPHQVRVLAERHANLHSVKESSGDIRRMTGIRAECGDRLAIFVGLDDLIVEGMMVGATGWVAGLVNALPRESVELYELCRRKEWDLAFRLYKWFLPLLRLDTVPKFVQLIKLVQAEVGWGSERVRPPRLPLEGAERDAALAIIRESLANRPSS